MALRKLRTEPGLSIDEKCGCYLYLGFVEVISGREAAAKNDFTQALKLNPDLLLDPVYVPPLILEIFNEARYEFEESEKTIPEEMAKDPAISSIEPVIIPRFCYLANMVVPGSGFFARKHTTRGAIWFVLEATSVAALVYSYDKMRESRRDYMKASLESELNRKYDRYNTWYKRTWGWGISTGIIYLASQVDLVYTVGRVQIQPHLTPTEAKAGLQFTISKK